VFRDHDEGRDQGGGGGGRLLPRDGNRTIPRVCMSMCVYVYACMYAYTHVGTFVCVYCCMYVYTYTQMYAYVRMCMYVYLYLYV